MVAGALLTAEKKLNIERSGVVRKVGVKSIHDGTLARVRTAEFGPCPEDDSGPVGVRFVERMGPYVVSGWGLFSWRS